MFSSSSSSFLQYPPQLATSRFPSTTHKQPCFTPSSVKFRPHKKTVAAAYTTAETKRPHFFSNEMASTASLYEVLGIPTSASCHEIKAAYRRLARMCHPDVVAINQKETSANEFMKIHTAYSTLSDPDKRASYDREFYRHRRPYGSSSMASAVAGFSGYTSRKWETDQCW